MNLYCDNYATCHEVLIDRGTRSANLARARAAGWHIFDGYTIGGDELYSVLGPGCVGTHRSRLTPAPMVQSGQQELFEMEAPE